MIRKTHQIFRRTPPSHVNPCALLLETFLLYWPKLRSLGRAKMALFDRAVRQAQVAFRFILPLCSLILLQIEPIHAQWRLASGHDGGVVYALAVSGTNLFAGCWIGGGVFLSTDNGTRWNPIDSG